MSKEIGEFEAPWSAHPERQASALGARTEKESCLDDGMIKAPQRTRSTSAHFFCSSKYLTTSTHNSFDALGARGDGYLRVGQDTCLESCLLESQICTSSIRNPPDKCVHGLRLRPPCPFPSCPKIPPLLICNWGRYRWSSSPPALVDSFESFGQRRASELTKGADYMSIPASVTERGATTSTQHPFAAA